jgi:hypothetical protein
VRGGERAASGSRGWSVFLLPTWGHPGVGGAPWRIGGRKGRVLRNRVTWSGLCMEGRQPMGSNGRFVVSL